jgi:hypothetical protein
MTPRDPAPDGTMGKLTRLKGTTGTTTVHQSAASPPLAERLKPLQAQFVALKRAGGQPADRAFFDDLSGTQ